MSELIKIEYQMKKTLVTFATLLTVLLFISSCKDDAKTTPATTTPSNFKFSTTSFTAGGPIPEKYSCDGVNINPALEWSGAPANTKSFAIIVDDPDAVPVAGKVWDHWLLCNIIPTTTAIKSGAGSADFFENRALIIKNSFGNNKYQGPCPPSGQNHTYEFKIYALSVATLPGITANSSKNALEDAIDANLIEKVVFTGTFVR
jgi:Raf kinase inhibitor-like YbhB/YbcL family protein